MTTLQLETYIFNCIARYDAKAWQYEQDTRQEIAIAVLLSASKQEALRMAGRNVQKMFRQFGFRQRDVHQRYKAHVRYGYELEQYQAIFN